MLFEFVDINQICQSVTSIEQSHVFKDHIFVSCHVTFHVN